MAFLLGVDTGGTYTDAVVYDDEAGVVLGAAKALTTHRSLDVGIGEAASAALAAADFPAANISLTSLSTTLATNALVEGHGDPTALIMIGFSEKDLSRAGLGDALGSDPVFFIAGGHKSSGDMVEALDAEAIRTACADAGGVSGFAVASVFATRNSAHEIAARDIISGATGKPVTCSHELSARLGGPKRALTTLLNGRLIAMIQRLIDGATGRLAELGVDAPLMVVKGDGALMSAGVARVRPIETILSGPAASVVGAAALTGLQDAVISDIGGTTTDIAVLTGGRPRIDPDGARVGGWRTMVEAVAMRTHGLGGDSEVGVQEGGLKPDITLGPRRAAPVSLYAATGGVVAEALIRQLDAPRPGDHDGVFAAKGARAVSDLDERSAAIVASVGEGAAVEDLGLGRRDLALLDRLFRAGALRRVAFTPTDAAHVLGLHDGFDAAAARQTAALFARQRGGDGKALFDDVEALAVRVIAKLRRRSAELVLEAAFEHDGFDEAGLPTSTLARAALDGRSGLAAFDLKVTAPLIGLGASAATYYPALGELLKTEVVIPEFAEVANAVGAVAGKVEMAAERMVLGSDREAFQVMGGEKPIIFTSESAALEAAETAATEEALARATLAGAADPKTHVSRDLKRAMIESRDVLVEARIVARAIGRPGF